MLNAVKYTQELEKAGFSREQAEASVKLLIDAMDDSFATKADLKELELVVRNDFSLLQNEFGKLHADVREGTIRFESGIREIEYRMTIKLGTMITLAVGLTATLVKLIQG